MPTSVILGQGGNGGGSGSNASVGATGGTPPASATELGIIIAGVFTAVSDINPLPISGTILASNPSVGLTGAHTAPTSATEIGVIDGSGNLQGASATNPVRIDPTGTTVQPVDGALTHNNAAPAGTNIGALVAVASVAAPTYTAGDQVLLSTDTAGALRVTGTIAGGSNIFEVSPTTAANTVSNPFFTQLSDGTHGITANSTTYTAKYGVDINLLGTLGTAFSTAGKIDIKAANGDAFVEIGDGTHAVTLNSTTYTAKYGLDVNLLGTLGTAFSTPGKIDVIASLASGAIFEVSPTTAANTVSNPFFTQLSDGTHGITANSTTYTAKYGVDINLLGTLGTAFSTAGKIDIKAANGDAFVEIGDGTHAVTLNSTTYTAKYGLDVNLLGTLGTAFSTPGKIDVTGTLTAVTAITNALPAGTNVIGHVIVDSGTITTVSAVTAITNALPAGTNVIGHVIVDSGTITTVSAVTAITNALPAGTNVIGHVIVDSGTVTTVSTVTAVTSITNAVKVTGNAGGAFDAVQGATPPANAVQVSAIAATALPTAATATNTVVPMADKYGRLIVLPQAPRDLVGTASVQNTGVSGTLIGAIASTYCDITNLVITNETATPTVVSVSDGTTTYKFALAASGGGVFPFSPPLPAASVNTNWTVSNSGSCTIDCVVTYVNNK